MKYNSLHEKLITLNWEKVSEDTYTNVSKCLYLTKTGKLHKLLYLGEEICYRSEYRLDLAEAWNHISSLAYPRTSEQQFLVDIEQVK